MQASGSRWWISSPGSQPPSGAAMNSCLPWPMVCALSLSSDQSLLRWLPPLLPRGPIAFAGECCPLKPHPKDIQLPLLVPWSFTPLGQLERKCYTALLCSFLSLLSMRSRFPWTYRGPSDSLIHLGCFDISLFPFGVPSQKQNK